MISSVEVLFIRGLQTSIDQQALSIRRELTYQRLDAHCGGGGGAREQISVSIDKVYARSTRTEGWFDMIMHATHLARIHVNVATV